MKYLGMDVRSVNREWIHYINTDGEEHRIGAYRSLIERIYRRAEEIESGLRFAVDFLLDAYRVKEAHTKQKYGFVGQEVVDEARKVGRLEGFIAEEDRKYRNKVAAEKLENLCGFHDAIIVLDREIADVEKIKEDALKAYQQLERAGK